MVFSYNQPISLSFPKSKPRKPFGPTTLEVMLSCPMRTCFDASPGFENRLGFAARIGLAFHQTIESFYKFPILKPSEEEVVSEARRRFLGNIRHQISESENHPREVGLPRNEDRMERAEEAIVQEAQKYYEQNEKPIYYWQGEEKYSATQIPLRKISIGDIEVEVPVQSRDGFFKGRIDRVEHLGEGVQLIDYKSALREDLPSRYMRQLQFYAYLWHESRNEWPLNAYVIYPLSASKYEIDLIPEECERVAEGFRKMLDKINREENQYQLASPGEICQVCDYRPWCLPFWNWQGNQESQTLALENAYWGFRGKVVSLKLINLHYQLLIQWQNSHVQIICPKERFPHLQNVHPGEEISVLEANLKGLRHQPRAIITPHTELFIYR